MEDGEIALLDCGQVKQISTEQRVGLANLIMMVNEWETLNNAILKASECESLAKDINNTIAQKSHSDKYKKKLETISNLSAAEIEEMKNKLSKLTGRLAKRVKEFGEL